MAKEVDQLLASIDHIDGVEIRRSTGANPHRHIYLRGVHVTTVPSSPSDHRGLLNARAALRRHGITPAVRGKKRKRERKPVDELLSLNELRARVESMHIPDFARFLVNDMPAIDPGLRTYASPESAAVAMRLFVKGGGLKPWTHLLLDSAVRAWDRVQARQPQPEPEIVTKLTATEASTGTTVTVEFQLEDLVALAERFGVRLNFEPRTEEEA